VSEPRVIRIPVPDTKWTHSLSTCSADEWRAGIDGPLGSVIEQAQEAVLDLLADGGGVILFVSSFPQHAAARTTVAGLHGLTRSIAKEYGARNIRCNLLVGEAPDLERFLTENPAMTGELLSTGSGLVGAAGLDGVAG
jgi:NAD(P)-dependent dehydrogenase (short-subunit alcohol dehydrogenase family)